MNDNQMTKNIMGTMPVPKLVLHTSIPLMFSLLVNALYNFVDSVFVSHVSEEALTALTLASPVQTLIAALGCGIAVGLNAAVSKALGEEDRQKVQETASAAIAMAVTAWLVIALSGLLILQPYFAWQSGGNTVVADYGKVYLRICMLLSLGQMGQWVFDRFLIATGKSVLFLYTLGCAAVVNIILDPILIFGYFGLPAMGTAGAAVATVIGQTSGAVLGIVLNRKKNQEIPIVFTRKVRFVCVRDILRVGVPTFVMQSIVAFLGITLNLFLLGFSGTAVAVYGACCRIQNIATVGANGINCGLIPIVAYNYGAKRRERMEQSIRWALIYSFFFASIIFGVLELLPGQILYLFDASENMLEIGIPALRILAAAYTVSTAALIFSSVFQALGKGDFSLGLTAARQMVFLLPLVILSAWLKNLSLMWLSFLFAELLALPVALVLYGKIKKKIINT